MLKHSQDETPIVYVDDNEKSLKELTLILKNNGFYVTALTGGFEALRTLEREKSYRGLVVKKEMAEMGGKEITLLVRENLPKEKLPILMLIDEKPTKEELMECMEFGVNAFALRKDANAIIKKLNDITGAQENKTK